MKANMDDYKEEIHRIVDQITSFQNVIGIYSFVRRIRIIEMEEKGDED